MKVYPNPGYVIEQIKHVKREIARLNRGPQTEEVIDTLRQLNRDLEFYRKLARCKLGAGQDIS